MLRLSRSNPPTSFLASGLLRCALRLALRPTPSPKLLAWEAALRDAHHARLAEARARGTEGQAQQCLQLLLLLELGHLKQQPTTTATTHQQHALDALASPPVPPTVTHTACRNTALASASLPVPWCCCARTVFLRLAAAPASAAAVAARMDASEFLLVLSWSMVLSRLSSVMSRPAGYMGSSARGERAPRQGSAKDGREQLHPARLLARQDGQ